MIEQARTESSKSFVTENGTAVALAGEAGTFTIDSRDTCGFPRRTGVGYKWFVELRNRDAAMAVTTLLPEEVVDTSNGEFKCTWTPAVIGAFEVWGSLAGNAATGAPFGTLVMLGVVEVRASLNDNERR